MCEDVKLSHLQLLLQGHDSMKCSFLKKQTNKHSSENPTIHLANSSCGPKLTQQSTVRASGSTALLIAHLLFTREGLKDPTRPWHTLSSMVQPSGVLTWEQPYAEHSHLWVSGVNKTDSALYLQ